MDVIYTGEIIFIKEAGIWLESTGQDAYIVFISNVWIKYLVLKKVGANLLLSLHGLCIIYWL